MYNPEFIIKTDDDVYIRQAVQKTESSLSMFSLLYTNSLLDAQFGHVLPVPVSTNSFALPAMCIVVAFALPGMQQAYWFRPPDEICCIPMLRPQCCHATCQACWMPSHQLSCDVVACKPLQFEQRSHSMRSTPITACAALPSQHAQHPHHSMRSIPITSKWCLLFHQWHVSCSTYCTVLYDTVRYCTVLDGTILFGMTP